MSDLICREALGQAMYHEAFETDSDEQRWDSGCWIRYKMFVPAQPKQKRGKWLKPTELSNPICSICHRCPNLLFGLTSKFCPHCGAEMEVER